MVIVTIHRFGQAARKVEAISFKVTNRLRGGGGGGFSSLTLELDPVAFAPWDRPTPRDWVMLETGSDVLFVGRVNHSGFSIDTHTISGHRERDGLHLNAVGFLDLDLDIATTPARSVTIGGLFAQIDWYDRVVERMTKQLDGAVGGSLRVFLDAIYNCDVPGTLFGLDASSRKTLGECVYPLFDKGSALTLAYGGPVEPVQGFSPAGVQSITKASGKAAQLLAGTFQPNDQLIELTATLLPYDEDKVLATIPFPRVGSGGQERKRGRILGLRYRMAPFRVAPLKDRIVLAGGGTGLTGPDATTHKRFNVGAFDRASWKELPKRTIRETVTRFESSMSGSSEVSATTAWLSFITGGEDARLSEILALPIIDEARTARDGLRLQTTLWPFVSPIGGGGAALDGPVGDDVDGLIGRIAATYYQFASPGALFEEGTVTLGLFSPHYEPGTVIRVPLGGRMFTAYVVEVTHSGHSDDSGHVEGGTTLTFARGLFDEALRDPFVPVLPYAGRTQTDSREEVLDPKADCAEGRPVGANGFAPILKPQRIEWLRTFAMAALDPSAVSIRQRMANVFKGTAAGTDETDHINVWAAAACLYVIQRYWRQKHPEARVRIAGPRGWTRFDDDKSHSATAGFDFYIELGAPIGGRVPAHRAWASLFKLAKAGRLPHGGKGLYLNVNPTTGVTVDQAGNLVPRNASNGGAGQYAGPGGSAGTHYDFAGSFGTVDVNPGNRNPHGQTWLATNWLGNGIDEIQAYRDVTRQILTSAGGGLVPRVFKSPATLKEAYLNIADPTNVLSQPNPSGAGLGQTEPKMMAAFQGLRRGFDEASRVPVRDAIEQYYEFTGRNDPTLFSVSVTVPNAMQVLGLEKWCDAAPATPPTSTGTIP